MKVLHVIPSMSAKDGGPTFAMSLIARALEQVGVEVHIATTEGLHDDSKSLCSRGAASVYDARRVSRDTGQKIFSFSRQTETYKISLPLFSWLSKNVHSYDLVHVHALFSFASYAAAGQAMKRAVPYVIRPLGVLNEWGMQNRRPLLKRLSFNLIEKRIIARAAAMHYTSEMERIEAERAGVTKESFVIPLGIDLSEFDELPGPERFFERFPMCRGRRVILFLSRLDQKKGLDLLLDAFADVHRRRPETLLVIAGDGASQFVERLKAQARGIAIADEIVWTGFLAGEDKLSAMSAASVLALPSSSENFGIAAAEALAAGLPSVLSDQIGIADDIREYKAGLIAARDKQQLAAGLLKLVDDDGVRTSMRTNSKRLAADKFSLEAMARSLTEMYDVLLLERARGSQRLFEQASAPVQARGEANPR